jgi:hypothetical protein
MSSGSWEEGNSMKQLPTNFLLVIGESMIWLSWL